MSQSNEADEIDVNRDYDFRMEINIAIDGQPQLTYYFSDDAARKMFVALDYTPTVEEYNVLSEHVIRRLRDLYDTVQEAQALLTMLATKVE